jgi:hypothetical protein
VGTTVQINNPSRYTCYGCSSVKTDEDMFVSDLPYPNDYLCSTCMAARLSDGTLTLAEPSETTCDDCMDTMQEGVSTYCQSCYDAQYENGQDNAECDHSSGCESCGDEPAYCKSCMVEGEEVLAPECDDCLSARKEGMKVLCKACLDKATEVATAAAAEPFEVEWNE